MKDIVIIGAGGTAKDIVSIINDINKESEQYNCVGILDDNNGLWGKFVAGVPVLGPINEVVNYASEKFVNSLGSPRNYKCRRDALAEYNIKPERFESIIHPSAVVSEDSNLGEGLILFPNTVVMSGVSLGNHVISLSQSVFNHDVVIGDYSIITSGVNISGGVKVGECCYLGSGCSIMQNTAIGNEALIGMGSVVLHDVEPGFVVAGNPARVIKNNNS